MVREALRAARERERDGAATGGEPPAPDAGPVAPASGSPRTGARTAARPGDAARAALRRANAERRGSGPAQESTEGHPAVPREAGTTSGPARRNAPAARPGDAAREALRAAREEAQRERTEGESKGVEAPGVEAQGVEARGAEARGVEVQGVEARGVEAQGVAAQGVEARGVEARGVEARGVEAQGVEAQGVEAKEVKAQGVKAQGVKGAETRRRSAAAGPSGTQVPAATRRRRDPRAPARGARARDVRELLAGAFALPASAAAQDGALSTARDTGDEHGDTPSPTPREEPSPSAWPRPAAPKPRPVPRHASPASPPAGARYPRSMAAPGRDGELRRTFAALPAPAAGEAGRFATTWWGDAWVAALEEGALDAARLARGRAYASRGNVDAITVTPGLVLAYVQGSRPRPYRVQVRLRTFSDDEWDRFLDAAAERPGHIAALLDKQVPTSLAECGVRLLPGPGDLEPHCGCPDFGHPCKHAAAVCYQTARLLDRDPFVLLLLRGRGERELLDALSRRNAARAARAARGRQPAPVPGVRARDAVARRALPPLPAPLPPPAHPEQPPVCPGVPGGPDPFALDQLATDAAARAHALLTTGEDPVAELTPWQDAVRLAAARPGSGLTAGTRALYSSLAAATGRTPADLARAVAAWRQGGREALAVLEEAWDPPAGRFDRARPLLLAADLPAFRPWRNRLTHPAGHAQLRLGQDGLWYAYESEPGREDWWPRGTPDPDPVGALTGLGAPEEG
ncbi:SWIM zinc finger family protein [Streptomyces sp. TP-A0356]|uniref:SWIM zinc finger family protein n=1 Tax=Streptomyces sp. TP-A0356 TaxID=1359208 RepID=UPI0006E3BA4D|nr:SWIM zinc finger family protein [Streptomyces sp. TP-A0356]